MIPSGGPYPLQTMGAELLQMAGGDPRTGGQHRWRLVRAIEGKERRNRTNIGKRKKKPAKYSIYWNDQINLMTEKNSPERNHRFLPSTVTNLIIIIYIGGSLFISN